MEHYTQKKQPQQQAQLISLNLIPLETFQATLRNFGVRGAAI